MTYHKPEVIQLDSAVKAIQGTIKGLMIFPETPQIWADTIGAYEADE